jgi:DNA-binding XRE family transcriptional regulator
VKVCSGEEKNLLSSCNQERDEPVICRKVNDSLPVLSRTKNRVSSLQAFGANVRRERVLRLITQEKLAELAALNVRTVAKIEAGELNLRSATIERIRQAIGCPLTRLL